MVGDIEKDKTRKAYDEVTFEYFAYLAGATKEKSRVLTAKIIQLQEQGDAVDLQVIEAAAAVARRRTARIRRFLISVRSPGRGRRRCARS